MKYFKSILAMCLVLFCLQNSFAQVDTNLVNQYYEKALVFDKQNQLDSAILLYEKTNTHALHLPETLKLWGIEKQLTCLNNLTAIFISQWDLDRALLLTDSIIKISENFIGDSTQFIARAYLHKGLAHFYTSKYDEAIKNYNKSLEIFIKIYGPNHKDVASTYNNLGLAYSEKADYDNALIYYFKSLNIRKELYQEKHISIARLFDNIGNVYCAIDEFKTALDYHSKSLKIKTDLLGEKNESVALSYNNIGNVYYAQSEFDKSLEYYLISLNIRIDNLGQFHPDVARSFGNIANVYFERGDYDKALEYYSKCLEILINLFGENHFDVALTYSNIGNVYLYSGNKEKALENNLKSLEIQKSLFGENNLSLVGPLFNIGNIYAEFGEYNKGMEFYFTCLKILDEQLGPKNYMASLIHNDLGMVYNRMGKQEKAIQHYHLGMASTLREFNDTSDLIKTPIIRNYINYASLLYNLMGKAKTFVIISQNNNYLSGFSSAEKLLVALKHYQAADTLIDQTRIRISAISDKLSLSDSASYVYESAINVCLQLAQISDKKKTDEYKQLAFYFSEKSKSQVLLQALSGQEAQKFAGIPDSLLEKEQNLKSDISFYEQKMAEGLDSSDEINIRNKLFTANRQYEYLISSFEKNYPKYYNLKYSTTNPSVKDLQKLLDAKTAIRSYFVGDSVIYIFTISNKKFDVQQVAKIGNLEDTIRYFRNGLTKFSSHMNEIYRQTGFLLYNQIFPKGSKIDKQIENLIIIPDGALAIMPFEALLTDNSGSLNGDDFKKYPFLINRYNVSYSYSANLFYQTFPKENQKQPELTNINDWLALAPVFDDKSEQGVMLATRELQKQLNNLQSDTLNVRGRLLTGDYITPLPGTESETQAIIKQYENRNLKAQALLHKSANEQFIKSGGLEKYKVLHFATHGFVNSEKPELSGILLAQDSTGNQDGVLYSGEIYNLKLNADLVVLSACETGLGKINKGEGIIGLTRALLYAGSKNIIVSLWQVSDESTSNLMIDFYNNLLNTKNKSFSDPLRKAKLKMISEGKFAHPFYWSPFILVGK